MDGDWVDTQSHYVWRIKHFHDVIEIEVYTPVGRFHEKGIGAINGGGVSFSLTNDLKGELKLSADGKRLRGNYGDPSAESLELEWRSR